MYDLKPYLEEIERVIAKGPFKDTWESLAKYKVPDWYKKVKFGIFVHWGIYSVPAFGSEWYSRNMYIKDSKEYKHHIETYGPHDRFGYKDFIPMFKAEKFDAREWSDLFKAAGAGYVVPVAEHHDGFQMYKSEISEWNAYEKGPKRDVLGELEAAFSENGIVTGVSSHRVEHWFFMGHGKEFESDVKEPMERGDFYWPAMPERDHMDVFSEPVPTEEYLNDWLVRTCEIIDKYRPRILYFDWWIQHSAVKPHLRKLAAYYYNRAAEWGEGVVINYKHDAFVFGSAVPDVERGQFAEIKPFIWQTDTAAALNSWGYTENNRYKNSEDIICDLVDIVSKNGRLLLNVGPRADGTIPDGDKKILLEIGEWLKVNGEAIYDTDVWRTYGEGSVKITEGQFTDGIKKEFTSEDIRFTTKNGYVYATVLKCNEEGTYSIKSLAHKKGSTVSQFSGIIKNVELLGFDGEIIWKMTENALEIKVAEGAVNVKTPVVFKVTVG